MKSSSQILRTDRSSRRSSTQDPVHGLTVEIGELPIRVRTDSLAFRHMLRNRYGEFLTCDSRHEAMKLDVELVNEHQDLGVRKGDDPDVRVRVERGRWVMERSDFLAEWDPEHNRGWVTLHANPYAIDAVLRILHSLLLARAGGFLVHAASVVRNGRASVFAGASGVGKSTLARLAPPGITLLTDEISYIGPGSKAHSESSKSRAANLDPSSTRESAGPAFHAFGTPFVGELARIGQKVNAPLRSLFLLKQGLENRIEPLSEVEAARGLLRHVLFFARDEELVRMIFETIFAFVTCVPVRRLVFAEDARVWDLIL